MLNQKGSADSIGLFGVIGIVFIILKLTSVIAWSWWWVLFPFWGGFAIALLFFTLIGVIGVMLSK